MKTRFDGICRVLSAVLVSALAGCAQPRRSPADAVILSQPTAVDPARVGLGCFSTIQPRPTRNYKRGDDFVMKSNAEVRAVRWWGLSEGRLFPDLRNFDEYTIEFFDGAPASGGPLPGTLIWRGSFPASSLEILPTGRLSPKSRASEHRYTATLPEGVELKRGGSYILAISARCIDPAGDAWQWQDAENFGGHGASYSYATQTWSVFEDTDSAFELIGSTWCETAR